MIKTEKQIRKDEREKVLEEVREIILQTLPIYESDKYGFDWRNEDRDELLSKINKL